MNDFTVIREILEILALAKDCIKMQYSLSFSTTGERRAKMAALRCIDLVSAKVMTLTITQADRGGATQREWGGMEVGTPTKEEEEEKSPPPPYRFPPQT